MIKNSSVKLYQHIVVINRLISERVNNCRGLFPLRINWEYIKVYGRGDSGSGGSLL